jgi:hypothetical protein
MSIELIERVDELAVAYLASISYPDYRQECVNDYKLSGEKVPPEKQIQSWYKDLIYFCNTVLSAKGIVKRFYNYSSKNPRGVCGRLFCHGSIQSIWGKYRGLLMRDTTTDIDMKNAHPVILRYICHKHNIPCPHLEYYINHRDDCLSLFENRDIGKKAYLKSTNTDKYVKGYTWEIPSQLKDYDKEMKVIQKKLVSLPEYKSLVDTVPIEKRDYNFNGSAINRILCYYENEILQLVIHVVRTHGIEIAVLMFDGLLIYGNHYENSQLLEEIESYINEQMPNLNMGWAYKEHDVSMSIPDDFHVKTISDTTKEREVELNGTLMFDCAAKRFEKLHAKILNSGLFVKQIEDDIIYMSKPVLTCAYENMTCLKSVGHDKYGFPLPPKTVNFINAWMKDNPNQRTYESVGCFPNPSKCPKNVYNTWIPFAMERVSEWKPHQDGLDCIRNHIKILCNHDVVVAEYFEKWIAQMIQYPEVKSICPVLISKEGSGKGTLLQLFAKMLGRKKVFETADPSRDVWGEFNLRLLSVFLVNLNELSKKDTVESEGEIKALITDPTLMINSKGINQFEILSYHRFIITTNKEEPITTTKDDRRKLIIRTSDELCGDKDYFTKMYALLDDVNVIKTCYEYFKSIPKMDQFGTLPIPKTIYQKEMAELSVSPIELWMKYYIERVDITKPLAEGEDNPLSMPTERLYKKYINWCEKYGTEFDRKISCLQFSVRLERLNIPGLSTKKTKTCNHKVIDLDVMKRHYGIGCLISTL